jgi:DNA-binding MarR family transcriptional regulator
MKADEENSTPQLVPAIERAVHLLALYLDRQLGALEISQAEAHVLARLGRGGSTSPTELHRLFGHKRSTLTGILDRLEARGYVTRVLNADDRRSFIVSLTSEGKIVAETVSATIEALERQIAARLSQRDLNGFFSLLAALEAETTGDSPSPAT